ncbi:MULTISPECIES: metal/formaldehyde-sensitive transcriptional repressor [unclassified Xanthobacter]|uniref:metal/formaldehyde-sensitive transcriptional repressor n=1 Tax=unclassified Xanthobacter TaxID=2623496 RepID=UPI001F34958E|nr:MULTISPECIES: metal/formaldehyde-sensitive transcriptional repressor [unclassified Xanthobacter]
MAHTRDPKHNAALLMRVKRIAGQMEAIERSLTAGAECADLLHQVAGVRGAVNGLMDEIFEAHLREHVAGPGLSDEERARGADELATILRRYAK